MIDDEFYELEVSDYVFFSNRFRQGEPPMTLDEFHDLKIGDWIWVEPMNKAYRVVSSLIDGEYYLSSNQAKPNMDFTPFSSFLEDYENECCLFINDIKHFKKLSNLDKMKLL